MKLWLSKNSEISLREQLTRQMIFAIVSGDLNAGEKLPSVREIALRFDVHQNTVSAAYKKLEREGWVESRKGSGVFVASNGNENGTFEINETQSKLDNLVAKFFRDAKRLGVSSESAKLRIEEYFLSAKPEKIVVMEDDPDLQQILLSEIRSEFEMPSVALTSDEIERNSPLKSIIVALPENFENLKPIRNAGNSFVAIMLNSAQAEMINSRKPLPQELIGVASRWDKFLRWAKTFLIATGIESENIVMRNAKKRDFKRGLESCLFVVADAATSKMLSGEFHVRTFNLIAESSIQEIRELIR